MAQVDVFNAAFVVGNLAIKIINRRLAEERTARVWYQLHLGDFTAKKGISSRRLTRTFVVGSKTREDVINLLVPGSQEWYYKDQPDGAACWLILYETVHHVKTLALTADIIEVGYRTAFLNQKPSASIDAWTLIALTYAMNGRASFDENPQGHQLCNLTTPRFVVRAWRRSFTEPWQGTFSTVRANAIIPCREREGWNALLQFGNTLWDRPLEKWLELLAPPTLAENHARWRGLKGENSSLACWSTEVAHRTMVERWLVSLTTHVASAHPPSELGDGLSQEFYDGWIEWHAAAVNLRERVETALMGRVGEIRDVRVHDAANRLYRAEDVVGRHIDDFPDTNTILHMGIISGYTTTYMLCCNWTYVIGSQYLLQGDNAAFYLA